MNKLILIPIFLLLLSFSVSAIQGEHYDGPPNSNQGISTTQDLYQEVKGVDVGFIDKIAMMIRSSSTPTTYTEVLIYNISATLPDSLIYNCSGNIPSSYDPGFVDTWINVSCGWEATGIDFAIVLHSGNVGANAHTWRGTSVGGYESTTYDSGYCDGQISSCVHQNDRDNLFQLYINETPAAVVPSDPTILTPTNNLLTADQPMPINILLNNDAVDIALVNYYINGTLNQSINISQNNFNANTTLNASDNQYTLSVSLLGTNGLSSNNATISSFKIDTVNPFDNLLSIIPSGTQIYRDMNYTITASNTNLYGHNLSVYDSLNNLVWSEEYLNISQANHDINLTIDVSALGTGIFTINSSESDDHTARAIRDYNVNQNINDLKLSFDTGSANIDVQLTEAKKVLTNQNKVSILSQIQSIGSSKNFDRYNFEFNFNTDQSSVDRYEFKAVVTSDKKIYPRSSSYLGHIMIGSEHWLDFEGSSITSVSVSQITDNQYEFLIISTSPNLLFESIGGVNQESSVTTLEIIAPSITSFLCNNASCLSFTEGDVLTDIGVTCTNATFANIRLDNSTNILFNAPANKFNDNWILDITDTTLLPLTYNISSDCGNEAGQIYDDFQFNVSLFTVEVITDTSPGRIQTLVLSVGGVLLSLVIIILLIRDSTNTNSRRGRK